MKKFALVLPLLLVAGVAFASQKPAEKPAAKTTAAKAMTHEVEAEVVSVDAKAKTITIKGDPENKTMPVDAKALASVKNLKAGEKATLICRDNEKGEHVAVEGVKAAAPEKK